MGDDGFETKEETETPESTYPDTERPPASHYVPGPPGSMGPPPLRPQARLGRTLAPKDMLLGEHQTPSPRPKSGATRELKAFGGKRTPSSPPPLRPSAPPPLPRSSASTMPGKRPASEPGAAARPPLRPSAPPPVMRPSSPPPLARPTAAKITATGHPSPSRRIAHPRNGEAPTVSLSPASKRTATGSPAPTGTTKPIEKRVSTSPWSDLPAATPRTQPLGRVSLKKQLVQKRPSAIREIQDERAFAADPRATGAMRTHASSTSDGGTRELREALLRAERDRASLLSRILKLESVPTADFRARLVALESAPPSPEEPEDGSQFQALHDALDQLRAELAPLREELEETKAALDELQTEREALRAEREALREELESVKAQLAEASSSPSSATNEALERIRGELEAQRNATATLGDELTELLDARIAEGLSSGVRDLPPFEDGEPIRSIIERISRLEKNLEEQGESELLFDDITDVQNALTARLSALEERIETPQSAGAQSTGSRRPAQRVSQSALTSIKGIGPKTAEKLQDAGIFTVEAIANLSPEQLGALAKAVPVSDARLRDWQDHAKRLMQTQG